MCPEEPALRVSVATDYRDPEQVIEPASVDPDGNDFRALKDGIERQARLQAAIPHFGSCPSIRAQPDPHFDIEVL